MGNDRITIEISPGELLDRITILEIKSVRLKDIEKRERVQKQLAALTEAWHNSAASQLDLDELRNELRVVNETLWDVEDELRRCEKECRFDGSFVELARRVYQTNDRRAELKRMIDQQVGSRLIEEKEYVDYRSIDGQAQTPSEQQSTYDYHAEILAGNDAYNRNDLAGAEVHYRRAVDLVPDSVEASYNLGVVLAGMEHCDEAADQFHRTLQLDPLTARAWNFLGVIDAMCERYDQAEQHYRKAIELQYQFPDAHFNLGQLLLRRGRLPEGFAESEWRWQTSQFAPLQCLHPRWDGKPLDGTLLIHTEQGAGDAMQFIRYIPMAAERCQRLILVCTKNLEPLFRSVPGIDQMRGAGKIRNDEFQQWLPLMSLPYLFGTTLDSIPSDAPYLAPPAEREPIELGSPDVNDARLRIGLSWAGSPTHKNDRHRSCLLSEFAPLLDIPGVAFYSLQVGEKGDQIHELGGRSHLVRDLRDCQTDFSDTALIIQQLDLVISVDTAVLHLAGALGWPTWGLLSRRCDWRWMIDREDTPWYPSVRLFRQQNLDDWPELMRRVAVALGEFESSKLTT